MRFLAISADASQGRNKKKGDEKREKVPGKQSRLLGAKKKTSPRHMEEAGAKKKKEPRPNEQGMSLCGVSPPPFSAPSFPSPPPLPLPREGEDWSGETGYTGRINEREEEEEEEGC